MANKKKPDELEQLEQSYRQLAGEPKNKKPRKGILAIVSIALVLALAGLCAYGLIGGSFLDGLLTMPDVTVAGIDLGGMSRKDAKQALEQLDYANTPMTVTVEDTVMTITPAQAGIAPDWNQLVNKAWFQSEGGAFDLVAAMGLNTQAVRDVAQQMGALYNVVAAKTQYQVEGKAPALEMDKADETGEMTLTVTIGQPSYQLDVDALYEKILAAYNSGSFAVTGDYVLTEPEIPTAQALFDEYAIAPTDAVMDPETFRITQELYGFGFDVSQAQAQLDHAGYGRVFTFSYTRIPASVTKESLEAELFKDELGFAKTPYSGADNNNRNTNLYLACAAMNGTIVYPGETFSYNESLGERTAERGWKPAASYASNGLTVDTYGGGICQGSSTLYLACLLADVEIVERYPHGYISSYIAPGMDASVNWGTADYRFKNNFNFPIRIEAWREKGYLNIRLWGTDEKDYYVKMTYQTLGSTAYETVYEEVKENDNPKGYKDGQVLVTPYTGYSVKTFKEFYDKETDEKLKTEFEVASWYSKRDKVVVKIVSDKPEETVPDETVPGETVPDDTAPEVTEPSETP